jgi:hypothetical protein
MLINCEENRILLRKDGKEKAEVRSQITEDGGWRKEGGEGRGKKKEDGRNLEDA